MPNKTLYIPDTDVPFWDAATAIAKRRGSSLSKVISLLLRDFAREDQKGVPVPVGFRVPASIKDPKELAREQAADDVRDLVLRYLERSEES